MQEDVRLETPPDRADAATGIGGESAHPAVVAHDYAEAGSVFGDFEPAYRYLEAQKTKLAGHLRDLESASNDGTASGRLSNFWLDIAYDAASRSRRRRADRPRANGRRKTAKVDEELCTDESATSPVPRFERPMFIKPTDGTLLDTSVRRPRGALAPASIGIAEGREPPSTIQIDLTPKIYRRITAVATNMQTVFPGEAERLQRIVDEPEIALGDRISCIEWEDGVAKLTPSTSESVPPHVRPHLHANGIHLFLDQ